MPREKHEDELGSAKSRVTRLGEFSPLGNSLQGTHLTDADGSSAAQTMTRNRFKESIFGHNLRTIFLIGVKFNLRK
jgi:hypothetical protein